MDTSSILLPSGYRIESVVRFALDGSCSIPSVSESAGCQIFGLPRSSGDCLTIKITKL